MWLYNPKTGRILLIHKPRVQQKINEGWLRATEAQIAEKLGLNVEEAPKEEEVEKVEVEEEAEEKPKRKRRTRAQMEAARKAKQ